jgi:mycobactin lysine-N-oxygenase
MVSDTSESQQPIASTSPLLVIVGAGPKAAAIAAKAQVLKELKEQGKLEIGEVRIIVIDRNKVAANWRGQAGFTDGEGELGTPPEKDIGYPYNSEYGSAVDLAMLRYSWQAHKIQLSKTAYSNWIDRGRWPPKHAEWAHYLETALEDASPQEIIREATVTSVEPAGGKLIVTAQHRTTARVIEADGVVFTGPGEPIKIKGEPSGSTNRILDGRNYWTSIPLFKEMRRGKVALIGGGETAASIALSLLERAPVLDIDIINRHGSIYTRGESFRENKQFSNPGEWLGMEEVNRLEFIQRTDRGVFSVAAQRQLDQAEKVDFISGEVSALEEAGDKIIVRLERGDPPREFEYEYDRVIVALGFDPFCMLKMIPERFRPKAETPDEQREIQRNIDEYLRLPFDTVPELAGTPPNIHVPMLAGLRQGPGFPNLSCLGHLSDRILSLYVGKSPQRSKSGT